MREKLSDPLYRNSFFLILTNGLTAVSGFIFWVLAARLYPAKDVGLASAAIALGQLVAMLSLMGFNMGTIKFVHELDAREVINSSTSFVAIVSAVMATSAVILSKYISKRTAELLVFPINILFVFFVVASALTIIFRQGIFVAIRDTKNSFIQSLATIPRLFILPLFVAFQAAGIFGSFTVTPFFGLTIGVILSYKAGYKLKFSFKTNLIKKMIMYSLSNYLSVILENLPAFILPIMVVNMLGAKENAYFYIAWAIAALFIKIPRSTSLSLFAECSYSENYIRKKVYKSIKFIMLLIIPGILAVYIGGKFLLLLFGEEYVINSLNLLEILVLAALPYSINTIYAAVYRAKKKMGRVIIIFFIISSITLLLSYILTKEGIGLISIGYSWFIGNLVAMVFVMSMVKMKSNKHTNSITKMKLDTSGIDIT